MPDWRTYISDHLAGLLKVEPEREHEITSELAQQLEQTYCEAMAGGASEHEAERRAKAQFRDWAGLAWEINEIGRAHV